jgi:hypothetical protein
MIATVYILICMNADCSLGFCVEPAMGEWKGEDHLVTC